MKLYAFPPSPNSAKVLALIGEIGLQVEVAVLDITKGQSRTPAMLAINPSGRTPVLVDGAIQLWESNAILQYLASRTPNPMWPAGDAARADIMRWQSWSLAHWTPPLQTLTFERTVKRLVGAGDPDEARCAEAEARFHPEARILDQHLTGRNWISGDGPTIADLEVGSSLMYAAVARHPIETYPNIRGWYARLSARPAWRSVMEPILAET
jgi:glutathione S-transferase